MAGYRGSAVVRRVKIPAPGAQGPVGPVLVFRGEYDASAIYYGNAGRIDAVKYQGKAYRTKSTSGSFQNTVPTNTAKWELFSEQFDSVATKLLLADAASIQNLVAKSLKTAVTGGRVEINADESNEIAIFDSAGVLRNLIRPSAIPSIATIEAGSATTNTSVTSSDMGVKSQAWSHPNFGIWSAAQVSAEFTIGAPFQSDSVLEVEIGNIGISAAVNPDYLADDRASGSATITIYLEKKNANNLWVQVGTIGQLTQMGAGSLSQTVSGTVRGLSVGLYRISAVHNHMTWTGYTGITQIVDGVTTTSDWSYASGQSSIAITVRKVIEQTIQGSNGFCTVWASNVYAHLSSSGFFFRFGNYRLEIGSSGVKINGVIHT